MAESNAKRLVFGVCIALLVLVSVGVASAKTIYVPEDYAKIQWAVDNATAGDTIIVKDGTYYENVVVDKQLTLKSENGSSSCIIDGGGSNNTVTTVTITADEVTIEGFTIISGDYPLNIGLRIESSGNTITSNNINISNKGYGIYLWYSSSSNNTISNNNISNNWDGIALYSSSNNTITSNYISNSHYGIWLYSSSNYNTITSNSISNNDYGIWLQDSSSNNNITGNTFTNDGLFVYSSYHNRVENNTVNGKPLVYFEDKSGTKVTDAGQVILVNCDSIEIRNLSLSNTTVGIELWNTTNSEITSNNISNNGDGIVLYSSSNNTISSNYISNRAWGIRLDSSSNNNITSNNISNNDNGIGICSSSNNTISNNIYSNNWNGIFLYYSSNYNTIIQNNIYLNNYEGIYLSFSSNNKIYMNNFINNTDNVYSSNSTNIWNFTEKITYTYKGSEFENYLGNYWDDYTGSDSDGDGIGDTPYSIDSDADNYPLMEPWENYFAPTENIFDTGSSENPYPSILGTHYGTITPNANITVSKLYTYPCEGTGGHTEYVRIWGNGEDASGTWAGYSGDWHNITLNRTITLEAGKTYNYEIKTGSYPQIIHKKELNAKGGKITCTSFVDANGKTYNDWIPAIRLE